VIATSQHGRESLIGYERIASVRVPAEWVSLLRCRLLTGRTHQIRVHLASNGWPILGDPVYGEPRWKGVRDARLAMVLREFPRQALHAWRLAFSHPATGERLEIEAAPPEDLRRLLSTLGLASPGTPPRPPRPAAGRDPACHGSFAQ
jgi:23S rRNA pseudouridine1911/1915/1917 synthase